MVDFYVEVLRKALGLRASATFHYSQCRYSSLRVCLALHCVRHRAVKRPKQGLIAFYLFQVLFGRACTFSSFLSSMWVPFDTFWS
jgi:hypothetical protein